MTPLRIIALLVLLPLVLVVAACIVIYTGDPRTLQPQCVVLCDAAAAVVTAEGAASGAITQRQERDLLRRGAP